ncbi:MAG: DUF4382 domain-containing protein [Chloroflexi bacterium]|nr:DUF4382 domain-containing protein [Chloroflexota bacterium]
MRFITLLLLMLALGVLSASAQDDATGSLEFRANGEGFVREGFVSKDGWSIAFDAIYVNLTRVRAHQTNPPYDAFSGELTASSHMVGLPGEMVIDLAEGDENADTLLVGVVEVAPAGYYNAVEWVMTPAESGPSAGYSLWIDGTAAKDGQTIPFVIRIDEEFAFSCGAFLGDERKGVVSAEATGQVEMTFHFDHIFGDADTPLDDSLNTGAPGFDMLAALALDGAVDVSLSDLEASLSADDFQMFSAVLPSLGHVGEGHCHES